MYELADAATTGDDKKMVDELGDVLFQVVFLALLLEERGASDLGDVATKLTEKLVRRHPHVFGDSEADGEPRKGGSAAGDAADLKVSDSGEVLANWDRIKREVEGRGADDPFADVPENLPGLLYARKILRRADPAGGGKPPVEEAVRDRAERWLGETLLELVRVSRTLGVDPELAVRSAADRLRPTA